MTTDKLRKYVLPYLPYVVMLWFGMKLGEAYRLAPGTDVLKKIVYSMETLGGALANPLPALNLFDFCVGVAGAGLVYGIVYMKKKKAKKWRKDVEYGSARWGNAADIKPYMDAKPDNNIILTQTEGLTMNPRPKPAKYARNKNILIVGGSGSGKTRFWLKPNLMQCQSKDYPVSFVVTDPKGTILIECGKMLERFGYKIKVLNTIDFGKSMKYNPFQYIHSEKDILKLVTALISNTKGEGKSGDDFWVSATRSHTNTIPQGKILWA